MLGFLLTLVSHSRLTQDHPRLGFAHCSTSYAEIQFYGRWGEKTGLCRFFRFWGLSLCAPLLSRCYRSTTRVPGWSSDSNSLLATTPATPYSTNVNSPSRYSTSRPNHAAFTCGKTAEGLRSSRSKVDPWDRRPPMRAITARAF